MMSIDKYLTLLPLWPSDSRTITTSILCSQAHLFATRNVTSILPIRASILGKKKSSMAKMPAPVRFGQIGILNGSVVSENNKITNT